MSNNKVKSTALLCALVAYYKGGATFRNLKKSHGFTDSEIRLSVSQSGGELEVYWKQNPNGGPRSERVKFSEKR